MVISYINTNARDGYIILRPSLSMSARRAMWVYVALSVYCIAIGGYFAVLGSWFVLPFSGVEVLTLLITGYIVRRRLARQEVVRFSESEIIVETGAVKAEDCWRVSRSWSSVIVSKPFHQHYPKTVSICFRSEYYEIGQFLVEEEREELVILLADLLPIRYIPSDSIS